MLIQKLLECIFIRKKKDIATNIVARWLPRVLVASFLI